MQLKQLILIKEFNTAFQRVLIYLYNNEVSNVSKAAVLVDKYILTHKSVFDNQPFNHTTKSFDP